MILIPGGDTILKILLKLGSEPPTICRIAKVFKGERGPVEFNWSGSAVKIALIKTKIESLAQFKFE